MKRISSILAVAALCAFIGGNAQAQSTGAVTSVTTSVTGSTQATGTAVGLAVGINTGFAHSVANSGPSGTSVSALTRETSRQSAKTQGNATAIVTTNGHASASAWATP